MGAEDGDLGDAFPGEGADGGEFCGAGLVGSRVGELDVDVAGVFDGVFCHEGADAFGDGEEELVGFFGGGVVVRGGVGGVGGFDD